MRLITLLTANVPKRTAAILLFLFFGLYGAYDLLTDLNIENIALFVALYFIIYVIGHQLLLHRYFTHRQFKVSNPLHYIFCFLSTTACLGSPLTYRFDHRLHHKFSDTEKDIHGPEIGLFRAFHSYKTERLYKVNEDRIKDDVVLFVHNNYYKIVLTTPALLLLFSTKLFFYFCFVVAFNVFVSDIFNYLNHYRYLGAYRNFETNDHSTNHVVWGYLAFCWHNNHHKYPFNANEQIKWWEVDLLYQFMIRWIQKKS